MLLSVDHFDICHSDYLNSHAGILVGIPLAGQTREEMAQAIVEEMSSRDDYELPGEYDDAQLLLAAIACIAEGARFWPRDENGNEIETTDTDDERLQQEQPYAWFRIEVISDEE